MIRIAFRNLINEILYALGKKRYVPYELPPSQRPFLAKDMATGRLFWYDGGEYEVPSKGLYE